MYAVFIILYCVLIYNYNYTSTNIYIYIYVVNNLMEKQKIKCAIELYNKLNDNANSKELKSSIFLYILSYI